MAKLPSRRRPPPVSPGAANPKPAVPPLTPSPSDDDIDDIDFGFGADDSLGAAEVEEKPPTATKTADDDEFSEGFGEDDSSDEEQPVDTGDARPAVTTLPARRQVPSKGKSRNPPLVQKPESANVHAARPREMVNLDKRVLTKKQKLSIEDWKGVNKGRKVDAYFAGTAAVARTKFGSEGTYVGSDTHNMMIGIPIPALPFEFLLAQDCYPLGHIMQVNGPPGTNKTSLMAEIIRWFVLNDGGANYLEAETKMSPDLLPSIIGWGRQSYITDRCDTLEEWQTRMTYYIEDHKKRLTGTKEEPGPGRSMPIVFGVDSLMGKLSNETIEKIKEAGFAGRQFPKEALSLTSYFKAVPAWIDQWPFAIVLNNHVKFSKDDNGNKKRNKGGGEQISFQQSYELEMSVVKQELKCAEWDGRVLQIRNYKNSFGPDQRRIQTRIIWWQEPNPNYDPDDPDETEPPTRQVTRWDWDWSTTRMIFDVFKNGGKLAERLKAVLHFATPSTAEITGTAYSATLNMKPKDAVSWSDFGQMINGNAKLKDAIRSALGIKRRPWLTGTSYGDLLEEKRKEMP